MGSDQKQFTRDQAVWILIDDEPVAARFVEYKRDADGDPVCVCTWSDLQLRGTVHAGPEIVFATRAACIRAIDQGNAATAAK